MKNSTENSVLSNLEKGDTEYEYTFKGKLENIFELLKGRKLCSPYFYPFLGKEWNVELELTECGELLYISISSNDHIEMETYCETSFSDTRDDIYYSENIKLSDCHNQELVPEFTRHQMEEYTLLLSDEFIITCQFKFLPIQFNEMRDSHPEHKTENFEHFLNDLKKMYEEAIYSDVILQVGGISIMAHKGFLCSQSPVFAKMFKHKLRESETRTVDIEDVDAATMKQFISLLYCPLINETLNFDLACNLYYVANKYEVLNLRYYIARILLDKMQESNSLRLLVLADQHCDDYLKTKILKFVNLHLKTLVESELWE